ncbi:MAG: [FeFe] hydrogenase H-cluster radical SAM maturase HydG [bacterium]
MNKIIDHERILQELNSKIDVSKAAVEQILQKARELKGISYHDVLTLLNISDPELSKKLFDTAKYVKDEIYGNRLVLFAPLYISNLCNNECLYCAFRNTNSKLVRRALNQEEIKKETEFLINEGHKRVLLVAGESYGKEGLDYVLRSIDTVYGVQTPKGNIRRINVNVAPLSVDEFKTLKGHKLGTYQIFQETYHYETYKTLHLKGPKSNYDYRLEVIDRAFTAGIEDVGIGILFGLYDWKYEILALLQHIKHLEEKFGIGPHTISIPRMEPALGSEVSYDPPYPVSDEDFKKIIAVLRLAVPYTGIILSTRENQQTRREAFELGITQISAGSKTNPGGYTEETDSHETSEFRDVGTESQFSLGDTRTMLDVIKDVVDAGHIPSFCTGCYRLGRVGHDFMEIAKPGLIKQHCLPNAMFTFSEYLYDFADDELRQKGFSLIDKMIKDDIKIESIKEKTILTLEQIKNGKRDLYF